LNLPPDVVTLLEDNDVDRAQLVALSTSVVSQADVISLKVLEVGESLAAGGPENHLFKPKLLVSGNRARQVGEGHLPWPA
jgi:hypothetical protein